MSLSVEDSFVEKIRSILFSARQTAAKAINSALVFAYWEIGMHIVQEEQKGKNRAEYGKYLLKELATKLSNDFEKSFNARELRRIRQFYLCFPIRDAVRPELSWTHYRLIIRVQDPSIRQFYLEEAISQHWSTRKLDRNISSQYYQRILANQTSKTIVNNIQHLNRLELIKDPYMLEFLKLPSNLAHKEKDIEKAIINHLQQFLLELGKGFAFIGRQYRITLNNRHYRVDLVFYHRILKCFVLIDLKVDKLQHHDIGQMNLYINYFKAEENMEDDNEPIGIILTTDKDEVLVEYATGGITNQLFVSKYQIYLPDRALLEQQVIAILDQA